MTTITKYFDDVLDPTGEYSRTDRFMDCSDCPIDSVCGRAAQRLIDKAADLITEMNKSAAPTSYIQSILNPVMETIEDIYIG